MGTMFCSLRLVLMRSNGNGRVLDGGSAVGEEKTSPVDKKSITKVAEDDIAKAGEMAMITGELMTTAGEMPSEAPEQPPGQEVAPPSLSLPRTTAGVLWPAALADWALLLQPCDLPVQFMLQEGVQVVDSGRFLGWLQRDVRLGPGDPPARYGALQGDLVRLRQILIPN